MKEQSPRNLQSLRKRHGYRSAKAFAEEVGFTPSAYAHYERDEGSMPMRSAIMIADALGVSLDEIVGRRPARVETPHPVQDAYDALDKQDREYIDEAFEFVDFRVDKRRRDAEARAKAESMQNCKRLFIEFVGTAKFDTSVIMPSELRQLFKNFVNDKANKRLNKEITTFAAAVKKEASEKPKKLTNQEKAILNSFELPEGMEYGEEAITAFNASRTEFWTDRCEGVMEAFDATPEFGVILGF